MYAIAINLNWVKNCFLGANIILFFIHPPIFLLKFWIFNAFFNQHPLFLQLFFKTYNCENNGNAGRLPETGGKSFFDDF
jgi:hypothetical protein